MALQKLACLLTVLWAGSITIWDPFASGWKSSGLTGRALPGPPLWDGRHLLGLWWHRCDVVGSGPPRESEDEQKRTETYWKCFWRVAEWTIDGRHVCDVTNPNKRHEDGGTVNSCFNIESFCYNFVNVEDKCSNISQQEVVNLEQKIWDFMAKICFHLWQKIYVFKTVWLYVKVTIIQNLLFIYCDRTTKISYFYIINMWTKNKKLQFCNMRYNMRYILNICFYKITIFLHKIVIL